MASRAVVHLLRLGQGACQASLHQHAPAVAHSLLNLVRPQPLAWLACSDAGLSTSGRTLQDLRRSSRSYSSAADAAKQQDEVNDLFTAARDEIEYAKEEAETVYFNESVAEAKKAVDICLTKWRALLDDVSDEERGKLMRSMGLKMEQLKAELDEVTKLHLEE